MRLSLMSVFKSGSGIGFARRSITCICFRQVYITKGHIFNLCQAKRNSISFGTLCLCHVLGMVLNVFSVVTPQNGIRRAIVVAFTESVGESISHKHDEAVYTCPPPLTGPGVAPLEVGWSHRGYQDALGTWNSSCA